MRTLCLGLLFLCCLAAQTQEPPGSTPMKKKTMNTIAEKTTLTVQKIIGGETISCKVVFEDDKVIAKQVSKSKKVKQPKGKEQVFTHTWEVDVGDLDPKVVQIKSGFPHTESWVVVLQTTDKKKLVVWRLEDSTAKQPLVERTDSFLLHVKDEATAKQVRAAWIQLIELYEKKQQ